MFVFYLAISCSLLFGLRVKRSGFYEDFLDRNQTDAIKGLFTLIVLLIVLASMKVKTGNRFLRWTGMCLFPIYIYQRLPMRAFVHWTGDEWICSNPYPFIVLCVAITGCIALLYKHWQIKLR